MDVMTIDLSSQLAERLSRLAAQQGRDPETLVEEAVRRYVEDAAITDLKPADIAKTQEQLTGELTNLPPWSSEPSDDAT